MGSFYGTETYAIDHKGRIVVPMHWRKVPGRSEPLDTFFLVNGFEGCIALYPEDEWQRVEDRLRAIPFGDRKGRKFARAFLRGANRVMVDTQGRITLPPWLVSRAGLGKEAVLHGQVDKIEIWNPETFRVQVESAESELEALGDEVLGDKD